MFSMIFSGICFASVVTESYLSPDGVTVEKLDSNRVVMTNAINSADGGLLQNETVTADKLDDNANPENRWNEAFNDFVFTGLLPPTSLTLTSTTTSGTAYINGTRVVKDATAKTYTLSKHTYIDLSDSGVFTYQEVTINAAEPSVSSNSIRLARVSTDSTKVLSVEDKRVTTLTSIIGVQSIQDADADTKIQTEKTTNEDILRFDLGSATLTTAREVLTIQAIDANDVKIEPTTDNDVDLGSSTKEFKDLYVDGTANIDTAAIDTVVITNPGITSSLDIQVVGVIDSETGALNVYSNTAQTNSGSSLLKLTQNNSSSTRVVFTLVNNGSHHSIVIDHNNASGNPITIESASSANTIQTDSGSGTQAHLTASGTWTNASSMYADKENISEIINLDYSEKIRDLKLFKYQKKWDVYGGMETVEVEENGKKVKKRKYKKEKANPDARYFYGPILDNPTTPEKLIPRDSEGNISGVSPALGVDFLLGVCKEQQITIDYLVEEVDKLKKGN
jgi:hypothetical protein